MQWPKEEWSLQKRPMVVSVRHNWRLWCTRKLRRSQLMTCVRIGDDICLSTSSACIYPTRVIIDILQYNWGLYNYSQKTYTLNRHHKNCDTYPIF